MAKLISNIGKQFINDDIDVRSILKRSFLVGASTEEACAYAGVPLAVYRDWEYTHDCYSNIKSLMYSGKYKSYSDITIEDIDTYNINTELLNKLIKNNNYGLDIYNLIETCNKAKAECIIYHLTNIYSPKKKKDSDWKSSAWYLERTNPARYGRDSKNNGDEVVIDKIQVNYVSSDSQASVERLKELEKEVKESLNITDEN